MKKAKQKKRDTIQCLVETIEDNEGCKYFKKGNLITVNDTLIIVDEQTKNQQIKELAQKMESRPNSGM